MPKRTAERRAARDEKRKLQIGLAVLAVAVIAIAFILLFNQGSASSLPAEISVDEAYKLYGQPDVVFVDVREPSEWNEYHAPNTTLIPLGELQSRVNELPKDKKIVVVCRSGNRSQQGRDILKAAGFTSVTSMAGGLKTWQASGYPTVSGP